MVARLVLEAFALVKLQVLEQNSGQLTARWRCASWRSRHRHPLQQCGTCCPHSRSGTQQQKQQTSSADTRYGGSEGVLLTVQHTGCIV